MDHTIKEVIGVAQRAGLEVVVWQASPDTADLLATAGVGALSVHDSGGLAAPDWRRSAAATDHGGE